MSKTAFSPANILLPRECGLTKWAVVACDQYTSQPEYWERVDKYVGDAPSTLRLILPESKLESDNVDQEIEKINHTMEQYLADGRLQELEDAMLLLERKLSNGKTRLGLLGKLDLEQYSYEKGSGTPIRATEGTVLSRIPPRMKVRRNAPIELPHIMVLIDDTERKWASTWLAYSQELDARRSIPLHASTITTRKRNVPDFTRRTNATKCGNGRQVSTGMRSPT